MCYETLQCMWKPWNETYSKYAVVMSYLQDLNQMPKIEHRHLKAFNSLSCSASKDARSTAVATLSKAEFLFSLTITDLFYHYKGCLYFPTLSLSVLCMILMELHKWVKYPTTFPPL